MPAIFEYAHTVAPEEIDILGHANNLAYVAWMQSAALAHSAAQGWPTDAYQRLGAGWVVRTHQITYRLPAFEGEQVVIHTWVAGMKKATSLRRYQMVRASDRKTLATAATDWAFITYATGLPTRIPAEIIRAFEIVPQESIDVR